MLNIFFLFFVGLFIVSLGWGIYRLCKHEEVWSPLIMLNLTNLGVQICNLVNILSK